MNMKIRWKKSCNTWKNIDSQNYSMKSWHESLMRDHKMQDIISLSIWKLLRKFPVMIHTAKKYISSKIRKDSQILIWPKKTLNQSLIPMMSWEFNQFLSHTYAKHYTWLVLKMLIMFLWWDIQNYAKKNTWIKFHLSSFYRKSTPDWAIVTMTLWEVLQEVVIKRCMNINEIWDNFEIIYLSIYFACFIVYWKYIFKNDSLIYAINIWYFKIFIHHQSFNFFHLCIFT